MAGNTFDDFGCTRVRQRGLLKTTCHKAALVAPGVKAAFDAHGRLLSDTQRLQGDGTRPPDHVPTELASDQAIQEQIRDSIVWGGPIVSHYGHFLTESVARLWASLPDSEHRDCPVVLIGKTSKQYETEWLDAFGVRRALITPGVLTRVSHLYVPEPAWRLNAWITPEVRDIHLRTRDGLAVPVAKSAQDVIWLSRTQLSSARRAYDEVMMEWLLKEHVTIVHPEKLGLGEQVGLLEACKGVIGGIGSAFHTLLMCKSVPESVCFCSPRFQSAHVAQAKLLGVNATFVQALALVRMRHHRLRKAPGESRLLIPEILRFLDANMLEGLLENDGRLARLALPELSWSSITGRKGRQTDDLIEGIIRVVLDPLNVWLRMKLGRAFEDRGLIECAIEQFMMVADLTDGYPKAPMRAAYLLSRSGQESEAKTMALRALKAGADPREAAIYLNGEQGD